MSHDNVSIASILKIRLQIDRKYFKSNYDTM